MRIIVIRIEGKMIASVRGENQQDPILLEKSVLIRETGSHRQVSSADLLGNSDALAIQHQGERYILRQTRAGKLILTK